jgi:hypothetical protein
MAMIKVYFIWMDFIFFLSRFLTCKFLRVGQAEEHGDSTQDFLPAHRPVGSVPRPAKESNSLSSGWKEPAGCTGKLDFFIVILVLGDDLHKLGQNVAQHPFGQCAHLAVDDLTA